MIGESQPWSREAGRSEMQSSQVGSSSWREPNAVRVRVTLLSIDPPIWRRLVLPIGWNLYQLHLGIQAAFNWWNTHLHEFRIGALTFGDVTGEVEPGERDLDERTITLHHLDYGIRAEPFLYHYDFGDSWCHRVEIEERLALDAKPRYGSCVGGARAGPPEDVGGTDGYEHFLDIMANADHPEHADMKAWCGGHFDPEWFDVERVDRDMRNALRKDPKRRRHQPKPSAGPVC